MEDLAGFFREGGIWPYLLLLLTLATPVAVLVLAAVNAKVRRIPAAVWWLGMSLILTVGALGTVIGMEEVVSAADFADRTSQMRIVLNGFFISLMNLAVAAAIMVPFGLLTTAGCVVSAALRVGPERSWTPKGPFLAVGIIFVVVWVLLVIAVFTEGIYLWSVGLPATLLIAGLVVSASGLCATDDEKKNNQLASDRWLVVVLAMVSVVFATIWSMISHLFFASDSILLSSPENRPRILSWHLEVITHIAIIGLIALVGLALASAVVLFIGAGRSISRTVLIDGVTSLVVLTPALIATVLMLIAMGPFFATIDEVVINPPPFEEIDDFDDDNYENDRFHRIEFDE